MDDFFKIDKQAFYNLERMVSRQQDRLLEQDRCEDDISLHDDMDVVIESDGEAFVSQLAPHVKPKSKRGKSKLMARRGTWPGSDPNREIL